MVSTLDFESSDPSSNLGRTLVLYCVNITFELDVHKSTNLFPFAREMKAGLNLSEISHTPRLRLIFSVLLSSVLDSIVVSIPACHAGDRGSIPRRGGFFLYIIQNQINIHVHRDTKSLQVQCAGHSVH